MNRETKRMMARQGAAGPDGAPPTPKGPPAATRRAVKREKTSPATFLREVRGELRRVAWPTRPEVVNYTTIVLITLAILMAFVFVVDFSFAKSVLFLFEVPE